MNNTLKYIFCLISIFTLVACKPSDEVEDSLALSVASISAPDFSAIYDVMVTTTATEFSATSDSEWCTSVAQSTTSSVKISVQKNRLLTSRKARVTITAGKKTAIVIINQLASVYAGANRDSVALLSLNTGTLKWNALQSMDTWEGVKIQSVNGVRRVTELNIPQKAYLSGSISDSIKNLSELNYLDLSALNLTGNLPVLKDLTKLLVLDLKNNKLSGAIPALPASLVYLSLGQNNFNGSLPVQLKELTKLLVLDLGINDFTGELPTEWSALINLKYFYLYGNVLTGPAPGFITSFLKLEALALDYNQLSGVIPSGLGNLSNLKQLSLQQNKFSGDVPTDLVSNTNWTRWMDSVIYQQNGVILKQPTNQNSVNQRKIKDNSIRIIYPLPDKSSFKELLSSGIGRE